jgi:hypothetical protein
LPGRLWYRVIYVAKRGYQREKREPMENLFGEGVINTEAIEKLTDEQVDTVLAILEKAGY